MNENLQSKLSEVTGGNSISFILNDNKDFSVTGYKVMQNQGSKGLLRCAKIKYNGKIKLVYIVEENKPLSYVATRLGVNELNVIVSNLVQRVIEIKANGFFKADNLELDFNKIFVDTSDYTVHLIYFPVVSSTTGKIAAFENEFRIALINLFNSFPVFNAPHFQRLCSDLANGALPFDEIVRRMTNNNISGYMGISSNNYVQGRNFTESAERPVNHNDTINVLKMRYRDQTGERDYACDKGSNHGRFEQDLPRTGPQPVLTITAVNAPMQFVLTVDTPEFLIGKNPNAVSGVVLYNPAISRIHCKITYVSGRYYLTDLGSANGTFLNSNKLERHQSAELHNGDYIKLANSNFVISF